MKYSHSIGFGLGCCLAAMAFGLATAPASAQAANGPGSLTGIWTNSSPPSADPRAQVLRTAEGKAPPLQPSAKALLDQRLKASRPGRPFAPASSLCLPASTPALLLYPDAPLQILETPGQVTMLSGKPNHYRVIRLDQPHVSDPDPTYKGDSVGHWDGDTLVVDTIGLNDKTALDPAGTPHSEDLHVVERYRRAAKDAIEVTFTLDDPKTFTGTWTAKTRLKPVNGRITQNLCDSKSAAFAAFGHAGAPPSSAIR